MWGNSQEKRERPNAGKAQAPLYCSINIELHIGRGGGRKIKVLVKKKTPNKAQQPGKMKGGKDPQIVELRDEFGRKKAPGNNARMRHSGKFLGKLTSQAERTRLGKMGKKTEWRGEQK